MSHDNLLEYDDMEIPLPIDQDSYTNTRPYPCDFCSRRFRKKANLMNHMVAHQTDRPHGCNLCGARYVRKCDLMNHLKIHAYAPSRDGLEDDLNDEDAMAQEEEETSKGRRKKVVEITNFNRVQLKRKFFVFIIFISLVFGRLSLVYCSIKYI